jgi:hypothetical protein
MPAPPLPSPSPSPSPLPLPWYSGSYSGLLELALISPT